MKQAQRERIAQFMLEHMQAKEQIVKMMLKPEYAEHLAKYAPILEEYRQPYV
jgi:hypothetical protein